MITEECLNPNHAYVVNITRKMNEFRSAETIDKAVILYIKYLVEKKFWARNHKEIENNPFENTGGEIIAVSDLCDLFIKAYNWDQEKDGYLKLYLFGDLVVEFKWYKHCLRGLEVKYVDSNPEEVCEFITDFLESEVEKIEEK